MPDRNAMVAPLSLSSVLTPDFETSLNLRNTILAPIISPDPDPDPVIPVSPIQVVGAGRPEEFCRRPAEALGGQNLSTERLSQRGQACHDHLPHGTHAPPSQGGNPRDEGMKAGLEGLG